MPVLAAEDGYTWNEITVSIAITVVVAVLVTLAATRIRHRYRRRAMDSSDDLAGRKARRTATVVGLLVGTVQVVAWFVVVVVVLSVLGVPLGPLFASAGVVGVALGFGAQAIVRDTLAGMFIALEGQFDVGDTVDIQSDGGLVSGTVEAFSLRITTVRQFDGTLSTVPNGGIHVTSNKTRGWGRAIVDVRVALSEDPEQIRRVLDELCAELAGEEPFSDWLRKPPTVLGVVQLTDVAQVVRVIAETSPQHRPDAERMLRERISARVTERGIRVPPISAVPGQTPGV